MKRLYVGNIPWNTTEAALREFFGDGPHCTMTKVNIIVGQDDRPRGFAFVDLSTDEEAAAAVKELHGAELGGRVITVSEAKERPPRPSQDKGRPAHPPSDNRKSSGNRRRRDPDDDSYGNE